MVFRPLTSKSAQCIGTGRPQYNDRREDDAGDDEHHDLHPKPRGEQVRRWFIHGKAEVRRASRM
jgi:hypothetical protein